MGQVICNNHITSIEASLLPNVSDSKNSTNHSTSGDLTPKASKSILKCKESIKNINQANQVKLLACRKIQSFIRGINFRSSFKANLATMKLANREMISEFLVRTKSDMLKLLDINLKPIPNNNQTLECSLNSRSPINGHCKNHYFYDFSHSNVLYSANLGIKDSKTTKSKKELKNIRFGPYLIIYSQTSYYFGEVNIRNQRHGSGIFQDMNGELLEGNWINDFLYGYGRIIDSQGNIIEGNENLLTI